MVSPDPQFVCDLTDSHNRLFGHLITLPGDLNDARDVLQETNLATLETAHSARRHNADLPTREGSRLGPARPRPEQGLAVVRFGSDGETITDYLRERAGSTVTPVVARETVDPGSIQGIAGRRHPTLPAPTLAIGLRRA